MRRFKLKYGGGVAWLVVITFLSMTIILIPLALTLLIELIEVVEIPNE